MGLRPTPTTRRTPSLIHQPPPSQLSHNPRDDTRTTKLDKVPFAGFHPNPQGIDRATCNSQEEEKEEEREEHALLPPL
ncbi:hypothetical protein CDAR_242601 [Caerostris darwini]|uniref:Uncharacterized protein n=1 Tax=Caerostris darwini TaxID=1538125 RepID=A0AAV4N0M6_9ARAC|nr:hypothetical protein CDAR_242601 [Caerostris darwini]